MKPLDSQQRADVRVRPECGRGPFDLSISGLDRNGHSSSVRSRGFSPLSLPTRDEPVIAIKAPKRAAILDDEDLANIQAYLKETSNAYESDWVKVLCSAKAGMRVSEIALLRTRAFTTADGEVAANVEVYAPKTRSSRDVPIHASLRKAFAALLEAYPACHYVAFSARYGHVKPQSAGTLATWFYRLYQEVGLVNCSSHSGRRTFATRLARIAGSHNQGISEVQRLLGHRRLSSTEAYVEPSTDVGALIDAI